MIPVPALVVISVAWPLWAVPFFGLPKGSAQTIDRRARWGIALEGVGFLFVWSAWAWATPPMPWWRWAAAVPFLVAGPLLSWTSARTLGRQWRFDAGLNADHQLVQGGAYRVVRHPIYASMFTLLIGTGLLITRLRFLAIAMVFFVAGTEIRVRIEDALLASRFGAAFEDYRRRVPAYIPFIR